MPLQCQPPALSRTTRRRGKRRLTGYSGFRQVGVSRQSILANRGFENRGGNDSCRDTWNDNPAFPPRFAPRFRGLFQLLRSKRIFANFPENRGACHDSYLGSFHPGSLEPGGAIGIGEDTAERGSAGKIKVSEVVMRPTRSALWRPAFRLDLCDEVRRPRNRNSGEPFRSDTTCRPFRS